MTKQAHISPAEKPTPELLRRFKLMDERVDKLKKENLAAGLDPKYMSQYIDYRDDFTLKKKYQNWLRKVLSIFRIAGQRRYS